MKRGKLFYLFSILLILFILPIISASYSCSGTASYQKTGQETCSDGIDCDYSSDGDRDTGWFGSSLNPPPKWVYGDLGNIKCISGVKARIWGRDGDKKYTPQTQNIQTSTNGVDWTPLETNWVINSFNIWVENSLTEVPARYVRFDITDCSFEQYWGFPWYDWYPCNCPYENMCNFQEFRILTRTATCVPDCTGMECGDDSCGGSCGTCTNNHGATSCNIGTCEPVCDANWDNCDTNTQNGCETDLRTEQDCGYCGNICINPGDMCISGVCTPPPPVYWTNMLGQVITRAEIGDTVVMVYEAGTAGQSFEIKEDDLTSSENIRTGQDAILGVITNGFLKAKYTITQEDYNLGDDGDGEVEFYFVINGETSSNLLVQENSEDNSPPTVQIIKPTIDEKFKTQNNTDFELIITDEDDDLQAIWDFGDGTSDSITNCLTTANCNTSHHYISSGTKTITLTAKEMTRTQSASEIIRILIYESGINIFPIITNPVLGEIIQGTSTVFFNGSGSFVSECSENTCPGVLCYNVDTLQCYDYLKTDIPLQYNLWFDWTFSEGLEKVGNWNEDYNEIVEFNQSFFIPTKHWAKLKVGYEASPIQWSEDTRTEFEVVSTAPQCIAETDASYWKYWDINIGQLVTEDVTDVNTNCYKPTGQPTTCCPNNKGECNIVSGVCDGITPPLYCEGYNADRYRGDIIAAETACNNFNGNTAERSVDLSVGEDDYCGSTQSEFDSGTGQTCWWLVTGCKCQWDSANSVCESAFSLSDSNCTGGSSSNIGTCTFETVTQIDQCNTRGSITYTWDATWSGIPADQPLDCTQQSREFACDNIVKMPFFTFFNFIITLVVITLIYTILIVNRKNQNKNELI